MKKSFTILALTIVNLVLLHGLLQAGIKSNDLLIAGKVCYKNTDVPVKNAVVKLYLVNSNQITYKVLESVVVNERGEYVFNSSQLNFGDKVRVGASLNDISVNDRTAGTNEMSTDEYAELGAYANDLTMDRVYPLSEIYGKTVPVDLSGVSLTNTNIFVEGTTVETEGLDGGGIGTYPKEPTLNQNYPNPFNPSTSIRFGIPEDGFVSLKVYDMSGKLVSELVSEMKSKGYYTVQFDGSNLASGFYIYRLSSGDFSSIKKMSLIK